MLDKEFHIRFTLADVGKALCFSPVVVVLVYVLICLPWGADNAAAWVQAVGSVIAIYVAIWVAARQRAELNAARIRQDRVTYELIELVAGRVKVGGNALSTVVRSQHVPPTKECVKRWLDYLERELKYLRGVDMLRLPDASLVHSLLLLMSNIEITITSIQEVVEPWNLNELIRRAASSAEGFESIERSLKAALEKLPVDRS